MRGLFFGMLVSAGTAVAATLATGALAEIDGHGPDAWRVTGVAADDVLNMPHIKALNDPDFVNYVKSYGRGFQWTGDVHHITKRWQNF